MLFDKPIKLIRLGCGDGRLEVRAVGHDHGIRDVRPVRGTETARALQIIARRKGRPLYGDGIGLVSKDASKRSEHHQRDQNAATRFFPGLHGLERNRRGRFRFPHDYEYAIDFHGLKTTRILLSCQYAFISIELQFHSASSL